MPIFSFYTMRILIFVSRYALGKTSEINLIGIVGFNTLAEENQENIKSHSERKWRYMAGSENRPLNPTHRYQVIEVLKKLSSRNSVKMRHNRKILEKLGKFDLRFSLIMEKKVSKEKKRLIGQKLKIIYELTREMKSTFSKSQNIKYQQSLL